MNQKKNHADEDHQRVDRDHEGYLRDVGDLRVDELRHERDTEDHRLRIRDGEDEALRKEPLAGVVGHLHARRIDHDLRRDLPPGLDRTRAPQASDLGKLFKSPL